eukprot:1147322-Pelagomonas_calceolata.AAC.12
MLSHAAAHLHRALTHAIDMCAEHWAPPCLHVKQLHTATYGPPQTAMCSYGTSHCHLWPPTNRHALVYCSTPAEHWAPPCVHVGLHTATFDQSPMKRHAVHFDLLAHPQSTGHRHAFMCHYKVGFSKDGRVSALDATLYSNVGNSMVSKWFGRWVGALELSKSVVESMVGYSNMGNSMVGKWLGRCVGASELGNSVVESMVGHSKVGSNMVGNWLGAGSGARAWQSNS